MYSDACEDKYTRTLSTFENVCLEDHLVIKLVGKLLLEEGEAVLFVPVPGRREPRDSVKQARARDRVKQARARNS